jgi:bidirectional [NiFe] hydrogenase diaphorase subunit
MTSTVHLTINGKPIEAPADATVLETARQMGIYIPALCYHEALAPAGTCRLCLVAVGNGTKQSVHISCKLNVVEGMTVVTDTKRINASRRLILKQLLDRAPTAEVIRDMAARYGVALDRSLPAEGNDCVLCGRCVRVCRDKIGPAIFAAVGRGTARKVIANADRLAQCIGCGACAQVCPTDAIRVIDARGYRQIYAWKEVLIEFELEKCEHCGTPFAPKRYLAFINQRAYVPKGIELVDHICPSCFKDGDRASERRRTGALRSSVNKWSVPR